MIEFKCANCKARLVAPPEYVGKVAKCKNCGEKVEVPIPSTASRHPQEQSPALAPRKSNGISHSAAELRKMMPPEVFDILAVGEMPENIAKALFDWGMYTYGLGQHTTGCIDEIKYDGHIVVLDDGTRWEVDDGDTHISDLWSPGDRVVIVDDEMFRLDELEKVNVQED